jgi:hypothetical protein
LPDAAAIARLRANGIGRLVVGHTPSGDCPAIVRDGDFELILADNSYGRIERGSQLFVTDDETRVHAMTELDDGSRRTVSFTSNRRDIDTPLGKRDRSTGHLVKARLGDDEYLLYRGLPKYLITQTAVNARELAGRSFDLART